MRRLALALVGALSIAACGGGDKSSSSASPTTPTPTQTTTRIINLIGGGINIGAVRVGSTASGSFLIRNDGTTSLTVSSVLVSNCAAMLRTSFSNGVIPAATQQSVTISFVPTLAQTCNGTLSVTSDATSGGNTIPYTASGTLDGLPVFTRSGVGNNVFDIPAYVTRIRITADYGDRCQNFIVHIAGRSVVNEILGTCSVQTTGSHYDGVSLIAGGGTAEVIDASGVRWLFTEQR